MRFTRIYAIGSMTKVNKHDQKIKNKRVGLVLYMTSMSLNVLALDVRGLSLFFSDHALKFEG